MPDTNQAKRIADKFGGAAALAEAIGVPYHRVGDWCRRIEYIPEAYRADVLRAAQRKGVDVTPYDFIRHLVGVQSAAPAAG